MAQAKTSSLRVQLIDLFSRIERERMVDVPVLNDALSVDAFGFDAEPTEGFVVGVLLTPWFMNLLLMPSDPTLLAGAHVGDKQSHVLPGGQFEFISSHEDELGTYLSCSFFSPMFQFVDQQAATDTAEAILSMVLDPKNAQENAPEQDEEMQAVWEGRLPEVEKTEDVDPQPQTETQPSSQPQPQSTRSNPSRRDLLLGLRSSSDVGDAIEPEGRL